MTALNQEASQIKINFKFSRARKVSSSEDFKKIIGIGTKIQTPYFSFFVLSNKISRSRFGFAIPKRVGKANERNKMRRILREFIRKKLELKPLPLDGVFIIRRSFLELEKVKLYQLFNYFFDKVIQRKFTVC